MKVYHLIYQIYFQLLFYIKWRSPSVSKLTPMIFNAGLTHLGSEASKYKESTEVKKKNVLI